MPASAGALPRNEAAAALLPPGVTGASVVAPDAAESAVTTAAEPVEVVFDGVVLRVVLVAVPPRRVGVDPRPEGLHASRPSDAEWTTPFEGASLPAEGCCRADMEVPADPGVEEDETAMGCDCRTLKQQFRSCPRALTRLRTGMRSETAKTKLGLNDLLAGTDCRPSYCLRATEPGAVVTTSTDGSPTPQTRAFAGCWCGHNEGTRPLRTCTPQGSFFIRGGGR